MPTKPLPPPVAPLGGTTPTATMPPRRRILPDTPRTWPRGRWSEATFVLGDLGLALAHFITWLVAGSARILFGAVRGLARGLGWVAGKISRGRIQGRSTEVVGWVLVVALIAGSYPAWGAARAWVDAHWPNDYVAYCTSSLE